MMRHDKNNFAPRNDVIRAAHRCDRPCVCGCATPQGERERLDGRRVGLRIGRQARRYESEPAVYGWVNLLQLLLVSGQGGRFCWGSLHVLPREKCRRQCLVSDVQQEEVTPQAVAHVASVTWVERLAIPSLALPPPPVFDPPVLIVQQVMQ